MEGKTLKHHHKNKWPVSVSFPPSLFSQMSQWLTAVQFESRITERKASAAERGSITVFPLVSHSDIDYTMKLLYKSIFTY